MAAVSDISSFLRLALYTLYFLHKTQTVTSVVQNEPFFHMEVADGVSCYDGAVFSPEFPS